MGHIKYIFDPLFPIRINIKSLLLVDIPIWKMFGWLMIAKELYRKTIELKMPQFHLFGHSHEVEKYNLWKKLETFFGFVSQYDAIIKPMTISEMVRQIH